jgi:gamma-glutamyltranspeptidase / glutathione hydrolase
VTLPQRVDRASLESLGEHAVVTPHHLASLAGMQTLERGGNAVDAAVAASAAMGVVAPETCGIGGDLFAIVHSPGDTRPKALNSSGRAGTGSTAAAIRALGLEQIPVESTFAVTVPGCVDGWVALNDAWGSRTLSDLLEPAIGYATTGFAASPELSSALGRLAPKLRPQPAAAGLYPGGSSPAVGDHVTRPTLADTLAAIGREGRGAFYNGPVARAIVAATRGAITLDDLNASKPDWVEPIAVDVMGWTGWTIPPNSQGYLTLAAAWLFEQLDPPRDPAHPDFTHAAIEAYRAVAWERDDFVCDSRFSPVPAAELLEPDRLRRRLGGIDISSRTAWPEPKPAPGGTAYLCTRDKWGMGVSLIQSNYHGIGSRIGAGNAGFFLHDRGSGFNLIPGHPNEIAPGKRPLHTLSPTLWTQAGELRMLLGTRGGDFQPQTLLQMLTYMRWAGLDAATAQLQPRWATREWRSEGGSTVAIEPHMESTAIAALQAYGHTVDPASGWMAGWGPVSVITGSSGNIAGAADPRVATTAALAHTDPV